MIQRIIGTGIILLIMHPTLPAQEVTDAGKALPKVIREETTIPVENIQSVGGFVGNRIEKNKDNYLETFPINTYVQLVEQRNFKDWDWRKGEQPGKWIESSILTSMRTQDKKLDAEVHDMYTRLINSQDADGYIGVTSKDIRTPEKPLRGMDAYELYFLQHALLTAYEEWHDEKALKAAEKLGDYFVQYIGEGKAEFWPTKDHYPENVGKTYKGTQHSDIAGHSIHYGWEGTLLIDPMLRLYQLSGDKKYFEWCKWVISKIDVWSGWNAFSKLDSVAVGTMTIDKIQPYVHAHTFQMNFLGFLRMYQLTGDVSYLKKVAGAWDDVTKRQTYITGGVSVGEHYEKDYVKPLTGKMIETCATMSWMQLSQYLLELTGDTKYADEMEKLLWNQVFAAQTEDGDCNRYNTPLNGAKPDGYFRTDGPDCCTGSGHRLMSLLPEFIYAGGNNAIYVNQFVSSQAVVPLNDGRSLNITQTTRYPDDGKILLTINEAPAIDVAINIRIPAWCTAPKIVIGMKSLANVKPGTYATITRQWEKGDKIEIELPMQLQFVAHDHFLKTADRKPYKTEPATDTPYALVRGPLVYAVDNIWYNGDTANMPKNVMNDVKYVLGNPNAYKPIKVDDTQMVGPGYEVPLVLSNGKQITMAVYPFANIGKWYKDANNKPDVNSSAYTYAVWLNTAKQDK